MKARAARLSLSRHKWLIFGLLLSVLCPLSSTGLALAQPEHNRDEALQQLSTMVTRAHDYEVAVSRWERNSTIIIALLVAVGIMGIAVSILQGFSTASCKLACVVMGGLVGSITLVNTTLFPADHRAFGYSALKARHVLNELKALLPSDPNTLSEGILEARIDKGLTLIKRMEALEETLYRAWASPGEPKALLRHAYAGDAESDLKRRLFSGTGEARLLSEARATAFTLAVNSAAEGLAAAWTHEGQERVDPYAVRPFIEKIVDVAKEDVTEERGLVRYRVVLAMPAEFARGYWFPSFGGQSRPEPLLSGDRVLLRGVPVARGSIGRDPRLKQQYWGLELGRLSLAAPEHATSFVITRAAGDTENRLIDDGSSVRIITAEGNLSPAGNGISARGDDRTVFRLRRVVDLPKRVGPRSVSGLRDGDSVEILLGTKILMASGDRIVLGDGPGAAVTIIRVARIAQLQK